MVSSLEVEKKEKPCTIFTNIFKSKVYWASLLLEKGQIFPQKGEILSTLWVKGEQRCTLCQRVFIASTASKLVCKNIGTAETVC